MPNLDVTFGTYIQQFKGPERAQRILKVFWKLIEILELVHDSNIVYNDLKPENIMINRKTGEVTLIDFGLASSYIN